MNARLIGLSTITTAAGAFAVLLLYVPALDAPFLVPKFAALELTASMGLVIWVMARGTTGRPRWMQPVTSGALLVLATTFIAWAATAWRGEGAPYATDALARWCSLFGVACVASVVSLDRGARGRLLETVTVAAGVVGAIGILQHLELMPLALPVISKPGSTFGNRNLAAEAIAMSLPLGLGATAQAPRREARLVLWISLGIELLYLAVTRARGAWVGALCGLAAAALLGRVRWSRAALALAGAGVVVAVIAATVPGRFNPRDAGDAKRYSAVAHVVHEGFDANSTALRTRLGLWRRTLAMVRDHPVFGVGPGNWPVVFPRYAEPGATSDGVLSASVVPRQAHDDLLERAAETGIPGLAALMVLAGSVGFAVRRRIGTDDRDDRQTTAAAAGALVSFVAVSVPGFPLEMPATLLLAGLALGLVAVDPDRPAGRPLTAPMSYAVLAGSLALVACIALRAERRLRASAWLGTAGRALHRDPGVGGSGEALLALDRALAAVPDDPFAELRRSRALLRVGRPTEASRAAERALAIEPYSPHAWEALAAAELEDGDPAAARRDATRALALLQDYPIALQGRADAAEQQGDKEAAKADLTRIAEIANGRASDDATQAARAVLESHSGLGR